MATISRLLKMIGLFCRISSLSEGFLQRRRIILRSLLIVATPYQTSGDLHTKRLSWGIYLFYVTYIYIYIHAYMYIHIYICTCVCVNMYMHIDLYAYTYSYIFIVSYAYIGMSLYIFIYIYIYIDVCTHTYMNIYIHIYICMYIYMYDICFQTDISRADAMRHLYLWM